MNRSLKIKSLEVYDRETRTTTTEEINEEQFFLWMDALRSGKFSQGRNALQSKEGFCCLGVACKVIIAEGMQYCISQSDEDYREGFKPLSGAYPDDQKYSPKWLNGLDKDFMRLSGARLSTLNDSGLRESFLDTSKVFKNRDIAPNVPLSFSQIADLLESVYVDGVTIHPDILKEREL